MKITASSNMFRVRLHRTCDVSNSYEFNKLLIGIDTQTADSDVTPKQRFIEKIHQLELQKDRSTPVFKMAKLMHMGSHNVFNKIQGLERLFNS